MQEFGFIRWKLKDSEQREESIQQGTWVKHQHLLLLHCKGGDEDLRG